jgi:predicted transcriptional regulator
MHIFEIREEAEKYEYYADENGRQEAIENCQWATKEEWIQDKIKEWMKNR